MTFDESSVLFTGGTGRLGKACGLVLPKAQRAGSRQLDVRSADSVASYFEAWRYAGDAVVPRDHWSYIESTAAFSQFFEDCNVFVVGAHVLHAGNAEGCRMRKRATCRA